MKSFLKKIIPESAAAGVRDIQNRVALARCGRNNFDARNLGNISEDALRGAFTDQTIEQAWVTDCAAIADIYKGRMMEGGVNPGDRRALYYLIAVLKPKNMLEVGTHIGASSIHIGMAMKRFNPDGIIDSVDIIDVNDPAKGPWVRAGLAASPFDMCQNLGCGAQIKFHARPSMDFMTGTNKKYDLVFLDGDHGAGTVYAEMGAALKILNPGGLILLHDYYPGGRPLYDDAMKITGPWMAMARARKENPDIDVLPLGALPWPTKKESRVTTLAIVRKVIQ